MSLTLHWLDWVVILVYFVGIVIVGLVAARRVKKTEDYFLGNREFSVWIVIAQAFGVGTHAEMPVSLAGAVFQSGYSAIWYQWKNLFITPFYWILAPLFRRFRRTTIGEVYEDRYGDLMGGVYTVFALAYFTFNMGAMLKGGGKLVSVASGGEVSPNTVVVAMTATFLAYSLVGGLVAAAYTDFVQSFFIIALSFLLIPLGLTAVGGFSGMREKLDPAMLSMVTPGDVGVFTIVMLTINGLIGIIAQPHMLAAVGTGHNERTCRIGMAYGNFVKRFCTIGWALVGLIVAVMIMNSGDTLLDREDAFGYATRELLFPGAVGLMIACVLAANMSTCSAFTVDGGALFTQNFYRRYVATDKPDHHYMTMGRIAGVSVTTLGVLFGLYVDIVLEAFLFTETIAAFMGISMFAAVAWRRANRHGALASLVLSSLLFFYLTYQQYGVFLRWEAANFGWSLLLGFIALVVVSLLTKPEPPSMLDPFYAKLKEQSFLDKSTGKETELVAEGHDLLVANLFDLQLSKGLGHFYRRFSVDINGLVVAFGVVVALIALAKGILYLP
jgi:Na+/proline symporter